ncbi:protein-L-isoaspartate O-methyltransferase [Altererythrobacter aurantiacus]|uniref:Protein-L-isoaspartate O-methyltransferase n=1 Tax=Parapontixanthobacter aurantiacus TaxID=1463599 RepID=A0A844ZIA6_9SPHN|nr:protein-L-isoaspartate O-methyltransferase [Parapontixanthobacter aurantiacus]MXO86866.1 protein-L-isoaspartate O-methyltransferase [Parapontixanthobacter aurantiacus]
MTAETADRTSNTDHIAARRAMIDSQLRTSGVNDGPALRRMGEVPREEFVPDSYRALAYMDRSIPLGDGRALASPLFHGTMLQEARPREADRTLIVDGGSGYLPALVEPMVGSMTVVSPEEAVSGKVPEGEYDLLLIDGAAEQVPPALVDRLTEDGRLVTGLLSKGVTRIAGGRKTRGHVALMTLLDTGIPVLHAFDVRKEWRF